MAFKRLAACLALVLLILALGTLIPRSGPGDGAGEPPTRTVLVLSNAIHTDIALPLDAETRGVFGFVRESGLSIDQSGAEWLVLGWGGEQFYVRTPTWADLEVMPVIRSILGDRSVLHVALSGPIDPDATFATRVVMSETDFSALRASILASFQRRENGEPDILEGTEYGLFDRFYRAKGNFQVLLGCNTWTGQMLREAGVTTGIWTPLPFLLRASLDLHN